MSAKKRSLYTMEYKMEAVRLVKAGQLLITPESKQLDVRPKKCMRHIVYATVLYNFH